MGESGLYDVVTFFAFVFVLLFLLFVFFGEVVVCLPLFFPVLLVLLVDFRRDFLAGRVSSSSDDSALSADDSESLTACLAPGNKKWNMCENA